MKPNVVRQSKTAGPTGCVSWSSRNAINMQHSGKAEAMSHLYAQPRLDNGRQNCRQRLYFKLKRRGASSCANWVTGSPSKLFIPRRQRKVGHEQDPCHLKATSPPRLHDPRREAFRIGGPARVLGNEASLSD